MEENDNALTRVDTEYGANQIQVLDGLEHVRKRPGMYIGGVDDKALHHLIWEVADNSIDEYLAGHGKRVIVTIEKAGSIMVQDFARGIPTDIHPKTGKSTLETVMTTLGAGGKFGGDSGYAMSGGLHGVGASVVNALSEWCIAKVYRDGKLYYQKYEKGVPTSDVKNQPQKDNGTRTGTTIQFLPDKTIFETMIFNYEYIQRRLRELAFLNKGLRIDLKDERDGKVESFHYEGGIKSYIEFLNKGKKTLNDIIYIEDNSDKELLVEFAMQYNTQYEETSLSFVNNIYTSMGGTHLTGFKSGLLKSLTKKVFPYYKNSDDPELKGLKKKLDKLENEMSQEDILEGLTVIVSVKMKDPQFEGQTKAKLASTKVRGKIDELTSRNVGEYFIHNKEVIKKILIKIIDATDARLAARQAKELSRQKGMLVQLESPFGNSVLPGKLTDCSNKEVNHREIFIIEGDSAAGCHAGFVKVSLADGRKVSFEDLEKEFNAGKENWVYTYNHANNSIGLEKIANAWKTKNTNELVKITLDNNEEIICTRNHPYMLRNGEYVNAEFLQVGQSLMPLYLEIKEQSFDYKHRKDIQKVRQDELVIQPNMTTKTLTYHLADAWNLKQGLDSIIPNVINHRHHKDKNPLNNNPNNIMRMDAYEHRKLHAHDSDDIKRTKEFRQYQRDYNLSISDEISERSKANWENPEYRNKYSENHWKNMREAQLSNPEYIEKFSKIMQDAWTDEMKEKQSNTTKTFFENNPQAIEHLRQKGKEQWANPEDRAKRAELTRINMQDPIRKENMRKKKIQTRIRKSLELLNQYGYAKYSEAIKETSSCKSTYNLDTLISKIVESGNANINSIEELLASSLYTYNHVIKSIEFIDEYMDVYDIEVPNTNNFALASGVFVHNSTKQARDSKSQACLPLKGKILNIEKAKEAKIYQNEEIQALMIAIGILQASEIKDKKKIEEDIENRNFDFKKIRYGKIILMTDADVDGSHIRCLLLTFLYRFAPELIEQGYIYVAQPPLFKLERGKKVDYFYTDQQLTDFKAKNDTKNLPISRFKGLGEMSPRQLWETTLDPKTRTLRKITLTEAEDYDFLFEMLMGENITARKKFIEDNAVYANIDV